MDIWTLKQIPLQLPVLILFERAVFVSVFTFRHNLLQTELHGLEIHVAKRKCNLAKIKLTENLWPSGTPGARVRH